MPGRVLRRKDADLEERRGSSGERTLGKIKTIVKNLEPERNGCERQGNMARPQSSREKEG